MVKRLLRRLLIVALVTAGVTGVAAVPAYASVGGCYDSHPTVSPCVNYGDSGTNVVRADFYLKHVPDAAYYSYRVAININGTFYNVSSTQLLGGTGRYCCWYKTYDNLPDTLNSAYTQVYIFNSSGILWLTPSSPTIYFWS